MTQPNADERRLENYFSQWVANEAISEDALAELQQHPIWSQRIAAVMQMNAMAQQAEVEPVSVPKWQRTQGFEQHLKQPSWWQQQGMSFVALSFSIFACVVMLFDLRVNVTDGGINIATASTQQKQQLTQELTAEFTRLEQQNNQLIQTRLDNFQLNQQQSTAQLVSYVLNNSRLERQEDIQDVVEVFQQQRKDDLLYLKQQFNDISYQVRKVQHSNNQSDPDHNVSLNPNNLYITEE